MLMTMIKEDKEKYTDILEDSITYLENHNFENIKADLEGYETPKSFTKAGSNISITPDVVATKEGRTYYFDISLKSEKPKLLKSKWLFLNTLSNLKSRRFKLITTRGHIQFSKEMLQDINLGDKKLIRI
ncbi:hypothetical protein DFQ02_101185 [Seonamhaeicola aphaedonensis]|uniref:Uncharacterized protein n=2 Tax=Seonamhaeicola aphaedonensis TaxID=1461338 RepID=A0A3D9HKY0_9FLAO|nr:hypothetical protein DFQ02_101185 [Seonamhaeicola aphaedonensis]